MPASGWTVSSAIKSQTLAEDIISHYDTSDTILDPSELLLLKRFSTDSSISTRDALLNELDMTDEPGTKPGERAAKSKGSLAGFVIARYGTDDPAFDEEEWEMLKEWFESGVDITHD